jgi:hypothetical protein
MTETSSISKIDCPNSLGRLIDVPFSAIIVYFKVFVAASYTGLNDSITAVSRLPDSVSSTIKASFGASAAKLFGPVVQLLTKPEVLIVFSHVGKL